MPTIYIKIKHLKQFLLIVVCVFLASFNYLTYAETTNATSEVCDKVNDSDCDGLTNSEEKLYGTNPELADTDGDGYSDGVEIKSGYDPLIAAPGDRVATIDNISSIGTDSQAAINTNSTTSLTDTFSQSIAAFIQSKGGQAITTDDVNTFVNTQLSDVMSAADNTNLPEIDTSKIKILKQDYATLSATDKKQKLSDDALKYLQQMAYLLINNSPTQLLTADDFSAFQETFFSNLSNLSDGSPASLEYFSDLGNRLEIFLNQAQDVEVPETMLSLHIKFLRINKGLLSLRSSDDNSLMFSDSLGKVLILSKISAYVNLYSDFFQNDFKNYFNTIQP